MLRQHCDNIVLFAMVNCPVCASAAAPAVPGGSDNHCRGRDLCPCPEAAGLSRSTVAQAREGSEGKRRSKHVFTPELHDRGGIAPA